MVLDHKCETLDIPWREDKNSDKKNTINEVKNTIKLNERRYQALQRIASLTQARGE